MQDQPTPPLPTDDLAPEVWWSEDGIDALIWADPQPYAGAPPGPPAEAAVPLLAGDPR
jgi:hypothetical protein